MRSDLLNELTAGQPPPSPDETASILKDLRRRHRRRQALNSAFVVLAMVGMAAAVSTWNANDSAQVVADTPVTTDSYSDDSPDGTIDRGEVAIRGVSVSSFALPEWLEPRAGHSIVWTGEELIVWGGRSADGALADGAIYNPQSNEWRQLADGPLQGRSDHVAVWTGEEMLIVGGQDVFASGTILTDGAGYDPAANSWRQIGNADLASPAAAELQIESVWTGELLVLWDRYNDEVAAFDPATNAWTALASPGLKRANVLGALRWTGTHLVALAGDGRLEAATFSPAVDVTWRPLPSIPYVDPFPSNSAVNTSGLIVWSRSARDDQTFRLDETSREWVSAAATPVNACEGHSEPLSVGGELFVMNACFDGDEGAAVLYNPQLDSWELTDLGPDERSDLGSAIWTGTEVLVIATQCCDNSPTEWAGTRYQFDK